MEELKPCIVESNKDGAIKSKVYPLDYAVRGNNWWPIIVITNNKCIFLANNRIQKAWAEKSDTFLYPKSWDQRIMISKFILPNGHLNLASFIPEKWEEVI